MAPVYSVKAPSDPKMKPGATIKELFLPPACGLQDILGSFCNQASCGLWSVLMESDCRIPVVCCRPRVLILHALFWGLVSLRVFGAALLSTDRPSENTPSPPCWWQEAFVVTTECLQCDAFQSRSWLACGPTGYVERVNCTRSNKDGIKSCRSTVMEEHRFWKFEGAMLALALLFGILVVVRQRWLDRLVSEKVRRQIESI